MQLCMGAPLILTLVKPDGWPTLMCLELPVDSQQRRAQSSPCSPLTAETRTSTPVRPRATPIRGPQRYAEATYALIEARCDRDTAIENRRLQLEQGRLQFEQDRLRFEIKRHEEKMKLKEMELQQRQAEQEAKFKLKELELQQRRQELEALAEERKHNRSYQEAQLEIIKSFINK
ncbi:uncharacterized protein LOC142777041 [Rhipicephalus microplus]|uniref:uncharacterized protein LOC142777041 n=1 Tax=Rhipicephalus microplus TaxID=6941 RepID=UPI003F6A9261